MSKTTLEQALRNAIDAERAAERFYSELASSMDNAQVADFFEIMAAQEAEHAGIISDYGDRLMAGELPAEPDMAVEMIETAPNWAYVESLSLEQALQMALELERHAQLYYETLADTIEGEIGQFYRVVAGQERQHAVQLEEMIQQLRQQPRQ